MRISKYPIIFISFFIFLSALFSLVFLKYYPFLFKSLIYHCPHLDCSRLVRLSTEAGVTLFQLMILFIGLTVIKLVVNYLKVFFLRRKLLKSVVKNHKVESLIKNLDWKENILVVSNQNPFAFCFGFLKPKIILSSGLTKIMNRRELTAVINHEKYHLEHKDALVLLLAKAVQSLFPFFPFISDCLKNYNIEKETMADELAIEMENGRNSLVTALKKLLKFDNPMAFSTIPNFTGVETLEVRIKSLTKKANTFQKFSLKNSVLSIFAFVILLSLTFAPLHTFSQGKNEIVTCINTNSCTDSCLNVIASPDEYRGVAIPTELR